MPTPLSLPTFTTTERDAISTPAEGMMLYNSTTDRVEIYNGASWISPEANWSNPGFPFVKYDRGDLLYYNTSGSSWDEVEIGSREVVKIQTQVYGTYVSFPGDLDTFDFKEILIYARVRINETGNYLPLKLTINNETSMTYYGHQYLAANNGAAVVSEANSNTIAQVVAASADTGSYSTVLIRIPFANVAFRRTIRSEFYGAKGTNNLYAGQIGLYFDKAEVIETLRLDNAPDNYGITADVYCYGIK